MTFINENLEEIWNCLLCEWQGPEEELATTYDDESAQNEYVCPYCLSRENPYQ